MLRANSAKGIVMVTRPNGWSTEKTLKQWMVAERIREAGLQVSMIIRTSLGH